MRSQCIHAFHEISEIKEAGWVPSLPARPAGSNSNSSGGATNLFEDPGVRPCSKENWLQDLERTNLKIDTFRMEVSLLERVQFAGGQFGSVVWKDVRLVGCDLANVVARRIALTRVELVDCRLTGFRAITLDWQDVLIQNGDARYAQLQGGKFRYLRIRWMQLAGRRFSGSGNLSGSIFRSCDLARADLRRAKLRNTDFRKSEVEGMLVGMGDLQGAIVDPAQAMILARVLGLQIL